MTYTPGHAEELASEFLDSEYRRSWAEDYLNTALALQIAALRRQRNWKQADLAANANTTQSAVSRMEDVAYGAHSIRVLKQVAAAFGLRLKVSFEEFGTLIEESAAFSEYALRRQSFDSDTRIAELLRSHNFSPQSTESQPALSFAEPITVITSPDAPVHDSFEEEFLAILEGCVQDRTYPLTRWLMGLGTSHQDEPPHQALYYALPADGSHAKYAQRLAEACVECLTPEKWSEILSDPYVGDSACIELLRISANLPSAHDIVEVALRGLLPHLSQTWADLSKNLRQAIFDLVVALRDSKVAISYPAIANELADYFERLAESNAALPLGVAVAVTTSIQSMSENAREELTMPWKIQMGTLVIKLRHHGGHVHRPGLALRRR